MSLLITFASNRITDFQMPSLREIKEFPDKYLKPTTRKNEIRHNALLKMPAYPAKIKQQNKH